MSIILTVLFFYFENFPHRKVCERVMSLLINVPYSDKEEVKKLGAKWNPQLKSWYIESERDYYKFVKWILAGKEQIDILSSKLFILQRQRVCYKCNRITPVYALIFPHHFTLYNMNRTEAMVPIVYDDNCIVSSIPALPATIEKQLELSSCYKDYSKTIGDYYIANHCCYCNSLQGNYPLFFEDDSPFDINNIYEDIVNNRALLNIRKVVLEFDFVANLDANAYIEDKGNVLETIISYA